MAEKAKYIDVKELSIILDTMKNPDSEFATDDYIDGFSDGISAAIKELEIMPATDVAKVVRCKDCEYNNECSVQDFGEMHQNDFCSHGKRKELDNDT